MRALVSVLLLMVLSPGAAQDPGEEAEARVILQRAADAVDVRSQGNSPFEVRGRFQVVAVYSDKKVPGTYALLWASSEKWREEITVGTARRVRVGRPGGHWQAQDLRPELSVIHEATRLLDMRRQMRRLQEERFLGLSRKKRKGRDVVCVKTESDKRGAMETCLDAESHFPVSQNVRGFFSGSTEYEFRAVGSKWFPQSMRRKQGDKTIAEFFLEEARDVPSFSDSLTERPEGAEEWPVCEAYEPSRVRMGPPDDEDPFNDRGTVLLYAVVGLDGKLHSPQVLISTFRKKSDARVDRLLQTIYHPARCNGKPVRSEEILSVWVKSGLGSFTIDW